MVRTGEVARCAHVGSQNPVILRDQHDSNYHSDKEYMAVVAGKQAGERQNDYQIQAEVPPFYENLSIEDHLDWIVEVERAFDVMDTPPENMVGFL